MRKTTTITTNAYLKHKIYLKFLSQEKTTKTPCTHSAEHVQGVKRELNP